MQADALASSAEDGAFTRCAKEPHSSDDCSCGARALTVVAGVWDTSCGVPVEDCHIQK
jgi:hypothetical protein